MYKVKFWFIKYKSFDALKFDKYVYVVIDNPQYCERNMKIQV